MPKNRKGEEDQVLRFRSDRFIHNEEKWYYETREGTTEGPFRTRQQAEEHLSNYIKLLQSGWWNDGAGGLELEPVQANSEPTSPHEHEPQTWAVRRGH